MAQAKNQSGVIVVGGREIDLSQYARMDASGWDASAAIDPMADIDAAFAGMEALDAVPPDPPCDHSPGDVRADNSCPWCRLVADYRARGGAR